MSELLKQDFSDRLGELQQDLDNLGVDFRIVGSLGTAAYLDPEGESINFDRPCAITADQKLPDVDIVVPRHQIETTRSYREQLINRQGSAAIKIGLAASSSTVDFRPGEETSYLTCKSVRVPFSTELFEPRNLRLMDGKVRTVDANTLFHTYQTFGGMLRPKDVPRALGLARLVRDNPDDYHTEPELAAFHSFISERRIHHPVSSGLERTMNGILTRLHPAVKNSMIACALPLAGLLGKR
jgi:hypothetical protein